MQTKTATISDGIATLEDGTAVDLKKMQSLFNSAFSDTGDHDFMKASDELAKLTGLEETANGFLPSDMPVVAKTSSTIPDATTMVPAWTMEHSRAASLEGWDIFYCSGSAYGLWQIQHFDEVQDNPDAKQLDDDEHAWREVFNGVLAHHVAAREFIRVHNPGEYLNFLKDVHPLKHLNATNQLRKLAGYTAGGFTVGHMAKMNGNPNEARIIDVNDMKSGTVLTLEFSTAQPVDAPEGSTSFFFEVPGRNISCTWRHEQT
jgi:hypothetical protein